MTSQQKTTALKLVNQLQELQAINSVLTQSEFDELQRERRSLVRALTEINDADVQAIVARYHRYRRIDVESQRLIERLAQRSTNDVEPVWAERT